MVTRIANVNEELRRFSFLSHLDEQELAQIADLCHQHSFAVGETCQVEGQVPERVNLILKGRVGAVIRIPNLISSTNNEIVMDSLPAGEAFGWTALIRQTPWSSLKVLEPTEVLYLNVDELLNLCENNHHIGYILMRNLAALITSRLRRNRMSTLNAIVAIKGI
jgi:CRP/FNR family transcriptional regulator, cyclic AMP receptor protein